MNTDFSQFSGIAELTAESCQYFETSIAKKPVVFAHFAILHEAEIKLNVRLFVLWASTPVPMFVRLDNKDVLGLLN